MIKIILYLFISFGLACSSTSFAQKKKTKVDFEDELISGDASAPDLLFLLKSKNIDYGKLLKLRDHFIPEMRETRFDVLRGGE